MSKIIALEMADDFESVKPYLVELIARIRFVCRVVPIVCR